MNGTGDWQALLETHWSLDGTLQCLPGEYDINLADQSRVYKIMHTDCDPALIDAQIACLEHLRGHALRVPLLMPARDGSLRVTLDTPNGPRLVWAISRLPGNTLAATTPITRSLVREIGAELARLHRALADFSHPALKRTLKWDLRQALAVRDDAASFAEHPLNDALAMIFETHAAPAIAALSALPEQATHNDPNDFNLLAGTEAFGTPTLTGLIDFGDMISAPRIGDLAIAAAYLMLLSERPFDSLFALVEGYCGEQSLERDELVLLWPLALTRMAVSAVNAFESERAGLNDPYLQVSQAAIRRFFERHLKVIAEMPTAGVLLAAGFAAPAEPLQQWLAANATHFAPVFKADLSDAPILDLSITGRDASDNPVNPSMLEIDAAVKRLAGASGRPVLGKYREARLVYGAPFYLSGNHQASDRRTIHIAVDVFLPASTLLHAPLDAVVHSAEVCDQDFDYGGLIVLRHQPSETLTFYTLYGHLSHASAAVLTPGQTIRQGEAFAELGEPAENGGWPPHVHFQLGLTDRPGSDWPGVVDVDLLPAWQAVFPDPAPLLGLPPGAATGSESSPELTSKARAAHSPASLRLSYDTPLQLLRGWQSLVFDSHGRTYLDAYNNVPHVGHSHPRVRAAIDRQLRLLNTNTRYLQPIHAAYTAALCARLPEPLSVCFLLSAGSEANELALRLARASTGSIDTLALRAGYHGHTIATIDISDYKLSGPGGGAPPDWVHFVANPDLFRGDYDRDGGPPATQFAAQVSATIDAMQQRDRKPACFIAETFPSVGGQLVPPLGWLQHVYEAVRAAGGVCIADEVQTGLGRLGHHFWGFEQQAVVPDIVVLGKPLGNGYPLAAVVTTPEIASAFDNGMEFFATFGGASVACAAGLEVLNIIDDEQLAARAADVGDYLLDGLRSLSQQHPLLADVRGMGLFIGVEIADPEKRPLSEATRYIVNRLRERRILIGSDGPNHNVLKIRPPLSFSREDADHLLGALSEILAETAVARSPAPH